MLCRAACQPQVVGRHLRSLPRLTKNKDLLELGSISLMTQIIGLFGHTGSGNNYYKRVTFLSCNCCGVFEIVYSNFLVIAITLVHKSRTA
jgi:hypothetical protein